MKMFLSALVLVVTSSLAQAAPMITRGPIPGTDVIEYPLVPGQPQEAWEIVQNLVNGTYLNYSRAPWGSTGSASEPIFACYTIAGGRKFAGIGYSQFQLQEVLNVVVQDAFGDWAEHITRCRPYSEMLAVDPRYSDIHYFFYMF